MERLVFSLSLVLAVASVGAEEGFHVYEVTGNYSHTPLVPGSKYQVHQLDRPQPPRVIPGAYEEQAISAAPSDAIILFDGSSLDEFGKSDWTIVDDYVVAGKKSLTTKRAFGDCQLHIEWRTPDPEIGEQMIGNMGNSGIYFMWMYELQIYDSYSSKNYPDGSAGAIYGQTPPLVNVCRRPREWQTYDIIFTAPIFDGDQLLKPARMTVFHNGVLIQNDTEILGKTEHQKAPAYKPHGPIGPIGLQGYKSPVEYRNIWIRDLSAQSQ
ncbi:3-keto-disaccharide hydrolase [Pontiella agarivorans]|uniref:DUF1080 domain-containing protein n=1 Tax=Pontiella agarivorans TaxID=3038953 RepID=A0ABU5MWX8_9BACT|nr:DUF1080 domain-containing protein [Pontiella agarivorans]MDZ8118466.1 DUF1080 domain-containing protein [Pontiella agarivorans]